MNLHRRHALRALGVSLSLPLLDAMAPTADARPSQFQPLGETLGQHPRVIACYVPNGVNILEWVPESNGRNFEPSKTLAELGDRLDDVTVLSGLGHPNAKGGHSGADTWLTGADLTGVPGSDYANTVSFDQLVAEQLGKETRIPSLQLSDLSGTGSANHSHTLSFNRSGTPIPAEDSPQRLFERLFVPETAGDREATLKRYAERKSILDSVMSDAKSLHKKLGREDREKLDEYLGSVRETEQRVERLENWVDVPKPEIDAQHLQLSSQPNNGHDRPMWIDVMLELSYLAMLTDTTRVITFQWSREAGGRGGGGENHHELSHHGGDADMLAKLGVIDRFHLSKLKRFLDFMADTKEADGRMLDNTVVLYGSGMNSGEGGEHSPKNLPLLVAGGQRLGLKTGQHIAHSTDDHPPLANVLLSVSKAVGLEIDRFQDSTGGLVGLS